MARKKLRILGVHGLGDHRNSTWKEDWKAAVLGAFPGRTDIELEFAFLSYDHIFEQVDISAWEAAKAVWKLARSGAGTALGRRRGVIGDVSDRIKWTAGYVVAWVEDDKFQEQTRKLVLSTIAAEKPDIILAHSLGSLITYNAFTHPDAGRDRVAGSLAAARYVTLGSQIGNPFVIRNLTPGRIEAPRVRYWYHLYNEEDDVFTAPIRIWDAENFTQVDTPFDIEGFADHSAVEYLKHVNTVENVWRPLAEQRINPRAFGATLVRRESRAALVKTGRMRAK